MKKKILLITAILTMVLFVGCDNNTSNFSYGTPQPSAVESSTAEPTESSAPEPTKEPEDAVFSRKDVSDEAIQSITTYNDYLDMYWLITEDFIANYEANVKDTVLYDKETFEKMKTSYKEAFEEQKKQYSPIGNTEIIGKDSIGKISMVEYLMNYRDSLKAIIDNLLDALN
jgi:hypothetical protein